MRTPEQFEQDKREMELRHKTAQDHIERAARLATADRPAHMSRDQVEQAVQTELLWAIVKQNQGLTR